MSTQFADQPVKHTSTVPATSTTTTSWVMFAGVLAIIAGAANLIWGWAALVQNNAIESTAPVFGDLIVGPLEFWGWVSIIWSLALFVTSWLLLAHHRAGKVVGVAVAAISAVFWLFALPAFPLFGLVVIAVDVLVMYGLMVHYDTE